MQHFKSLRTRTVFAISLILGFILVTFGCATSKNQQSINNFGMEAKAIPEGILLTFKNIPSDAVRMCIFASYYNEETPDPSNTVTSMADLRDASLLNDRVKVAQLDKVKQTGKVILPVIQPGKRYHISATVWNEQDHTLFKNNDENFRFISAATDCIVNDGIHFNSDALYLKLDDNNTVAALSSEPVFSSDIIFETPKYSYGVTIDVQGKGAIGVTSYHIPDGLSSNGLTWTFEPYMTADIKKDIPDGWLEKGNGYTAFVEAYANIVYDNVLWFIETAQSCEFTYIYN
ncbi:MAG: hypothetical protein LBI04_01025 [Treponema sp.]|nr:hypothetical protein [Treponema sp.]